MKTTATTAAVSSPPEENEHWSQQWRRNTAGAGQKSRADWKKDLHNLGAGRKSRKPPTPFVGMKPYGKCQFNMRNTIPILFVAATLLAGCHSPSQVHTQTTAPTVTALPPFQPMFITTTFCTQTSPDGSWKIGVSEDAIHFASPAGGETSYGWQAKAGWFVFIESESRVWAYDGDRQLYLDTQISNTGSLYFGVFRATNFDSNFPCAVPAEVISHLPEQRQKEIQTHG